MMFLGSVKLAAPSRTAWIAGANIRKSRPRQCRPGLVVRAIVDRLGRKMTGCIKPAPPAAIDPLHHARTSLEDATHILRVPTASGYEYLGVGSVPDRTTLGEKLARIQHPLQHFADDLHAVPTPPESTALGHSPGEAYHHALMRQMLRGADGEHFGAVLVAARDAEGNPTRYTIKRAPDHRVHLRLRDRKRPEDEVPHQGSGLDVTPAQLGYLEAHPPKSGVEVGPSGDVFARWSRIALPATDSEGKPIPGRPPRVRYEVRLLPSVYGGKEAYDQLYQVPLWSVAADEAVAERRFRTFIDKARSRFFPRETDRPPAGDVTDLLRRHNGDVTGLIQSGELGHENVHGTTKRQHTVAPRKPISSSEMQYLVSRWRAQHPAAVGAIRQEVQRRHPSFNDDALLDDAIDRGVELAIHRFDPEHGVDFTRFARATARGEVLAAAHALGAAHGAERFASHGAASEHDGADDDERSPRAPEADEPTFDDDAAERGERGGGEAAARGTVEPARRRRTTPANDRDVGSQTAFERVLEEALPDQPEDRRILSALYPTGNFTGGAAYKEAARKTGLPLETFFKYAPVVQRLKAHPAYARYHARHLREAEERKMEEQGIARSLGQGEPLLHRVVAAIEGEEQVLQLAKRLRGRSS